MANTRISRVPKEEQLKLINECRTSGMTDIDWCCEHGIAVSAFYYWVKQLRKEAAHAELFKRLKVHKEVIPLNEEDSSRLSGRLSGISGNR